MNRKIRVIHFGDKFGKAGATMHGVTKLLSWWFTRWDTSRFDMKLVGLRANDPGVPRIREVVPDVVCFERGIFDPRCLTDMLGVIRSYKADIVHLHGYAGADFGRIAAKLAGVPIVIHEHWVDPALPVYQGIADRLLAPWCDHAFAVSKSVRDFMIEKRHMRADRIEVLYNGAPLAEFSATTPGEIAALRRHWEIPEGRLLLGTVGRLDPQKGNTHLLDALARLVALGHDVGVMIVGDGPLAEPLRDQAQRLGIIDRVIFAGYQSNIAQLQSMFTVQVFPSLWEGTPLTLFEAMATARPIVSTDVDGLGEILRDGVDALVVAPGSGDTLAAALDGLLKDPLRREQLAQQAFAASRNHDISRMVARMQAVYETLAAGGVPSIAPT